MTTLRANTAARGASGHGSPQHPATALAALPPALAAAGSPAPAFLGDHAFLLWRPGTFNTVPLIRFSVCHACQMAPPLSPGLCAPLPFCIMAAVVTWAADFLATADADHTFSLSKASAKASGHPPFFNGGRITTAACFATHTELPAVLRTDRPHRHGMQYMVGSIYSSSCITSESCIHETCLQNGRKNGTVISAYYL